MVELTWFLVGVGLLRGAPQETYNFVPSEQWSELRAEGLARFNWGATSSQVCGTFTTTGKLDLEVPVKSIKMGMSWEVQTLRQWMEAEAHPTITFRSEKVTQADNGFWTIDGTLTVRGVSKPVTLTATIKSIRADLPRVKLGPGRWVRLTTEFDLKLSDYGIVIHGDRTLIPDTWSVNVALLGTTERWR